MLTAIFCLVVFRIIAWSNGVTDELLQIKSDSISDDDIAVRYNDHRLLKIRVESDAQLTKLQKLQAQWLTEDSVENSIEFWNEPSKINDSVILRIPPTKITSVEEACNSTGVNFITLTTDLQTWIDKEKNENALSNDGLDLRNGEFNHDMYHTLDKINQSLLMLHQQHPDKTRLLILGTTSEGRQILGLRIGSGEPDRPAILVDGGMHAREWISPAVLMYIIHTLLREHDSDATYLTEKVDWYLFPVLNPDGYEYSWKSNRLWRKNRRKTFQFSRFCRGVDPNRNFASNFGRRGSSSNPCAENFAGAYPFSEKESQAIRTGLTRLSSRLIVYLNVHSYSQMIMSPYGHTKVKPTNFDEMNAAMNSFSKGLEKHFNTTYKYGQAADIMYHTSGAAIDWAYTEAKVKYPMVIELRDKGKFGFILPNEYIIPSGLEMIEGLRSLIEHLDSKGEVVVKKIDVESRW